MLEPDLYRVFRSVRSYPTLAAGTMPPNLFGGIASDLEGYQHLPPLLKVLDVQPLFCEP